MSSFDIVRAWKDPEYRRSLSAEEQTFLPEHPAGSIELTDEELREAAGAWSNFLACSSAACSIPYTCGDPNNCPLQGLA